MDAHRWRANRCDLVRTYYRRRQTRRKAARLRPGIGLSWRRLALLQRGIQPLRVMSARWIFQRQPRHERDEPRLTLAQRFSRVSGTRHKVSAFKVRERREPFGMSLRPSRWLWRSGLAFSRWKWNFRK